MDWASLEVAVLAAASAAAAASCSPVRAAMRASFSCIFAVSPSIWLVTSAFAVRFAAERAALSFSSCVLAKASCAALASACALAAISLFARAACPASPSLAFFSAAKARSSSACFSPVLACAARSSAAMAPISTSLALSVLPILAAASASFLERSASRALPAVISPLSLFISDSILTRSSFSDARLAMVRTTSSFSCFISSLVLAKSPANLLLSATNAASAAALPSLVARAQAACAATAAAASADFASTASCAAFKAGSRRLTFSIDPLSSSLTSVSWYVFSATSAVDLLVIAF